MFEVDLNTLTTELGVNYILPPINNEYMKDLAFIAHIKKDMRKKLADEIPMDIIHTHRPNRNKGTNFNNTPFEHHFEGRIQIVDAVEWRAFKKAYYNCNKTTVIRVPR